MGIVLSVTIGGALITALLCLWYETTSNNHPFRTAAGKAATGGGVYAAVVAIVFIIVLIITNLTSASDCRRLEAFYYDNAEVYREAVTATEDALYLELSEIDEAKLLSAENWKQSTNLSDRIKEISERYAYFNTELRKKRYWSNNPWTNWFVQQPAEDVKYLKLTLE